MCNIYRNTTEMVSNRTADSRHVALPILWYILKINSGTVMCCPYLLLTGRNHIFHHLSPKSCCALNCTSLLLSSAYLPEQMIPALSLYFHSGAD